MRVLKFSAEWCSPCKLMKPAWEKLIQEFDDVDFVDIDVDQDPQTASEYKVMAVPTVVIEDQGSIVDTFVGLHTFDQLADTVRKAKGE